MKAELDSFDRNGGTVYIGFALPEVDMPEIVVGAEWELHPPGAVCEWTEDDDGNWHTDCGEAFVLTEGTPSENRMRFCHRCGRPLKEVKK